MSYLKFDSKEQATKAFELAFGRILKLGSRATRPGDVEEYEKCKDIIIDVKEYLDH